MITKFSVIRYLPNPLSGESLNIGVIAWGEGIIASQFVKNWTRVKAFGREDISFVQDFIERIENSATLNKKLPSLGPEPVDVKHLEKMATDWNNSIQFSEVRTSLQSPDEVIRQVSPVYLPELPHRERTGRSKRAAAALAWDSITRVLVDSRGPSASNFVKRQFGIKGKIDQHIFDVVVANGHPYAAANGLSFERTFSRSVQKDVDATAWAIDDVRKAHRNLPVAVLALTQSNSYEPVQRAKKIFRSLNADLVSESEIKTWAKGALRKLPELPFSEVSRVSS